MLKSFALRGREVPLPLYGPTGLRDLLASCGASSATSRTRSRRSSSTPGDAIDRGDYEIRAFAVDHGRRLSAT
jgi:ribonuclease BN (tRNA processing enzyme)